MDGPEPGTFSHVREATAGEVIPDLFFVERRKVDSREWQLKRNCSLTPGQAIAAFAVLSASTLAVGVAFLVLHGTWIVLGFASAEISVIAAAFLHYARHATDREHIALAGNSLLIEQFDAGAVRQTRLDVYGIRITPPRHGRDMIVLEARGIKVEVGRFVTETTRRQIAGELRRVFDVPPAGSFGQS